MSPKDKRNSPNHSQSPQGGNENTQRRNPVILISLISGMIVVTALSSSVITALILKQSIPSGSNNSTTSPTATVAESPTASPTATVAESPTALPTATVAESPTASPSGTAVSLLNMECLSSTPDVEESLVKQREPKNIAIGGEVLPEIAYLFSGSSSYAYITNNKPAAVSCALNSKFRELNLVVGINGKHIEARQGNNILFEVSLDNKVVAKKDLTVASKQILNINVQNVQSVGIKAICPAPYNGICPYVAFVEANLR
jgi:hypothetical protein